MTPTPRLVPDRPSDALPSPYCYLGLEPGCETWRVYDEDGPLRVPVWTRTLIDAAAPPAERGEDVDERDAFKASHRHFDLSETQDEWGQTTFTHSHIDAMWCGWKARADQALAAATAGAVALNAEYTRGRNDGWEAAKAAPAAPAEGDGAQAIADEMDAWAAAKMTGPASSRLDRTMVREWATRLRGSNDDEDAYVIERMGKLLAEIAVIVNGPEPPLTRWSYHDLPEKVRALATAPRVTGGREAITGYVNGYLHGAQCVEFKADAPLPAWLTASPGLRVTLALQAATGGVG